MTWTAHSLAALAPALATVPLPLEVSLPLAVSLVVEGAPALESVRAGIVAVLVVVGSGFLVAGTIGLLRFDTVYNRMHATTKPTSIGVVAIFLASFVHFGPGGAGLPSLVGIVFLFLTIPTGAHMIARSAERMGVPFREGVTWPEPPGGDPTSDAADRDRPGAEPDTERAEGPGTERAGKPGTERAEEPGTEPTEESSTEPSEEPGTKPPEDSDDEPPE